MLEARRRGLNMSSGLLLSILLLAAPLALGESRDNEENNNKLLNKERLAEGECVAMKDEYKVQPRVSWGLAMHLLQVGQVATLLYSRDRYYYIHVSSYWYYYYYMYIYISSCCRYRRYSRGGRRWTAMCDWK
jgi:hypothetical protein